MTHLDDAATVWDDAEWDANHPGTLEAQRCLEGLPEPRRIDPDEDHYWWRQEQRRSAILPGSWADHDPVGAFARLDDVVELFQSFRFHPHHERYAEVMWHWRKIVRGAS